MSDYRTFVVPYDFSLHAKAALFAAADLARRLGADLHLIHVIHHPLYAQGGLYPGLPPPAATVDVREGATKMLREVASGLADLPGAVECHVYEGSTIADVIAEAAGKLEADLIVMGTHGHTGLAHVFLGSVAERTLRRAPCPVLSVQAPEQADAL